MGNSQGVPWPAGPSVWRSAGPSAVSGLLLRASSVGTPCLWVISYRRNLEEGSTPTDVSPFISWGSLIHQSDPSGAIGELV